LEDGAHLLVLDALRAEQLQGALGAGARVEADPQRDLPAQIAVGARLGLLIRDAVVGLQEQRGRQEARGALGRPLSAQ
jgi:hypothetical protein